MNLLDHFHPPLSIQRPWHGFHHAWASIISFDLNARLPDGYFSSPNIQYGIEIDVAAFEESQAGGEHSASIGAAARFWQGAQPTQTLGLPVITDVVEALVFRDEGGPILVGAIELVSPANKDRIGHREAFVSKCLAYLGQGVGLVIVDVCSSRRANLHDDLLGRLIAADAKKLETPLYAAAYHPVERDELPVVDIWQEELEIGRGLPTMPLCLKGGPKLALDLSGTYSRTCAEQRIPPER